MCCRWALLRLPARVDATSRDAGKGHPSPAPLQTQGPGGGRLRISFFSPVLPLPSPALQAHPPGLGFPSPCQETTAAFPAPWLRGRCCSCPWDVCHKGGWWGALKRPSTHTRVRGRQPPPPPPSPWRGGSRQGRPRGCPARGGGASAPVPAPPQTSRRYPAPTRQCCWVLAGG